MATREVGGGDPLGRPVRRFLDLATALDLHRGHGLAFHPRAGRFEKVDSGGGRWAFYVEEGEALGWLPAGQVPPEELADWPDRACVPGATVEPERRWQDELPPLGEGQERRPGWRVEAEAFLPLALRALLPHREGGSDGT